MLYCMFNIYEKAKNYVILPDMLYRIETTHKNFLCETIIPSVGFFAYPIHIFEVKYLTSHKCA